MSGFLHRLAAQALGQTTPVRSAARLPYSEPAPFAATLTDFDERSAGLPEHQTTAVGHPAARNPGVIPGFGDETPDVRAADPPPVREPASHRSIPTQAAVNQSRHPAPAALVERRTDAEPSGETAGELRPGGEMDIASHTRGPGEGWPDAAPQTAIRSRRGLPQIRRPTQPSPLLKPAPATIVREQRLAPQPASERTGKVAETTEVHVSIGRIEVTAVHEATPPRRPAPRATQPTSLTEYLARRGGAGR
jgi:hypothetical protein